MISKQLRPMLFKRQCRRPPLFFILAGLTVVAACGRSNNAYVPPPPAKVTVARPIQEPVTLYFELTGNTAAINSIDLVARVQGFLESIDYKDGATVTKGTLLFGIQRDTYQAQLDQAKASLASNQAAQTNAQSNYQRQLTLSKQEFASQATYENAKTQLDQAVASTLNAKASLDLANINLGYTRVLAPIDGVVTNHLVDIGSLVGVSAPTKLATIVQTDPLYVYFNVSEPQVLMIKDGLAKQGRTLKQIDLAKIPVEIGLQGEEGYPHKGRLNYAAPEVDSATGTLLARGLFDNKDQTLLPGLFVRVRVPVTHIDKAFLVRDDAIGTNQQGSYVLVLGKDDVIEQRLVKTGQRQGQLRIIESGLTADDWVVTAGIQSAIPGSKVIPDKVAMAKDANGSPAAAPKTNTP